MRWRLSLAAAAIVFTALAPRTAPAGDAQGKLRVLIIDGQGEHDWRATTRALKSHLEARGRFSVDSASAPRRPGLAASEEVMVEYHHAMTAFVPDLGRYDVMIDNYCGDPWSPHLRRTLEDRLRAGRIGLVVIHASTGRIAGWAEFDRMVGLTSGDPSHSATIVKEETDEGPANLSSGHASCRVTKQPALVKIREADHPITRGMPAEWVHAPEEIHGLHGLSTGIRLLATYGPFGGAASSGDEPAAWTVDYHRGRVFATSMGHDGDGRRCVGFATLVCRGAEWAATGRVSQSLPEDFPTECDIRTTGER